MIQFKAGKRPGQTDIVGFGLSEKNVEQLKASHPISVWGAEMGLPFDIMIFYGKDEKTMTRDLKAFINPEHTFVHDTSEKKTTRQ